MAAASDVGVVREQVAESLRLITALERKVEQQREGREDDRVAVWLDRLGHVVGEQVAMLTKRLAELGGLVEPPAPSALASGARGDQRGMTDAAVLQQHAGALMEAMVAYTRLYTTARVLFDADTCDLAAQHLRALARAVQVIGWLLPDVVAQALQQGQELFCRCVCPSCSLGACLCVRNSTDTVLHAWDGSAPFGTTLDARESPPEVLAEWQLEWLLPGPGVALRGDARPGSPLADVGVRRGDRILAVDGTAVDGNRTIQAALGAHPVGDEVRLTIERADGQLTERSVRRVEGRPS